MEIEIQFKDYFMVDGKNCLAVKYSEIEKARLIDSVYIITFVSGNVRLFPIQNIIGIYETGEL